MSNYSKFNIVYRLQKWMDSVSGQTFLNYAYSWGASIVILGTLFKLTHLPLANLMLFLGMGTEVFVFFISAFDRPFDKTADGQELTTSTAAKLAKLAEKEAENADVETGEETVATNGATIVGGGGAAVVGGGSAQIIVTGNGGNGSVEIPEGIAPAVGGVQPQVTPEQLAELSNPLWLQQQQEKTPEMEEAQNDYVDVLKKLTEMLKKVCEQSERLTTDSQEMENLNRTLTAICKIYEMQLKSTSSQVATIDQINEQTRKMASQIEQLNNIYTRMIEAMTVNMKVAAPGVNLDK
ncbi:MAG: gliding motility protein GldL [Bacteroidaceae bacterium]|nr:gliding motility protein GldL [Bacteroidaceae bacterium]